MTVVDGGRGVGAAGARRARQLEAVDAWAEARAQREQAWQANVTSREARMDAARRVAVLDRADDAIRARLGELPVDDEPVAVVAHRHEWFADKVREALEERGFTVVLAGENGADALGVVVAEQPDVLLVGDTLAMLPGDQLLAEAALFSPRTVLAAQVPYGDDVGRMLDAGARTAFTRQIPPAEVASSLAGLVGAARRT